VALALGAGATFVARTVDADQAHMAMVLKRAAEHRGTAFVEIYQNCAVFNDGAFDALIDRKLRDDTRLLLEHGKPLVFGKERNKGIRLSGFTPEVANLGESVTDADLIAHDETAGDGGLAFLLSQLDTPQFPVPLGVFRAIDAPTYDALNSRLHAEARERFGKGNLATLLESGNNTWTIT
jgi:2-oxoglutarate ferredoxin oxidoreductase subunit beta